MLPQASPAHARERGQDLVEFALTLLPLFILVIGILDLGRAAYAYAVLHNAAREGCRYGVINPDDTDTIKNVVVNRGLGLNLVPDDVTVELLDLYSNVPGDDTVQVSVTYDFTIVTPFIGALFGGSNPVTLVTQAAMRLEK
jgi:Flp pilus assembly protein TadG